MTTCFVGAAGGSAVAAFVYERWSWDGVCVLGAAVSLFGLALWAFGPRHSAADREEAADERAVRAAAADESAGR